MLAQPAERIAQPAVRIARCRRAMGVLRVAAVQLRVSRDRASNLRRAAELIDAAAADGAQFVALPECFTGKYGVDLFHGHREALAADADGAAAASGSAVLAAAAKRHGVVATGGVIEEHAGKLYNTMPVYGPDGALVAAYRKVHLSRVLGITSESDVLEAGDEATAFEAGGVRVGMACCFDLRFPEWLRRHGPRGAAPADVVCAPSAFLDVTGRDHWDLLLRRTALDGQAFVVGPNVAHDAEDAVPLHGRSAVVSPWGDVLAQCGADADDLAVADVSTDRVAEVRAKLPLADWAE